MTDYERKLLAYRTMGARSRNAGASFEHIIDAACQWYRDRNIADIEKTPEPMRPIKSIGNGRFIAVYTGEAQADYKGYTSGGRAVYFEAKATSSDRIKKDRVTKNQTERLERAYRMGAEVFVLCSFDNREFFRVPWVVWRDMKKIFGHVYFTQEQAREEELEIRFEPPGILKFL